MACIPRITLVHTNPPRSPLRPYRAGIVRWFVDLVNDGNTSAVVNVSITLTAPMTGSTTATDIPVTPGASISLLPESPGTAWLEYDLSKLAPGEVKVHIVCDPDDDAPEAKTVERFSSLVFA